MATVCPVSAQANGGQPNGHHHQHHDSQQHQPAPAKVTSIKSLTDSAKLTSLPSIYRFPGADPQAVSDPSLPVIDLSLLTAGNPEQRSRVIADLAKACEEWGVFLVINHGISESLWDAMIDVCKGFFDLSEEEKKDYEGKDVLYPVRCGTSIDASTGQVMLWRDFLSSLVHPEFHSPSKPENFREVLAQYARAVRRIVRELLRGISEGLGLGPDYLDEVLDMESSLQRLTANLYPPCPQPELAMGIPAHTDHGVLTTLMQNGVGGLQVYQGGRWVKVDPPPNALMLNTADHLEIVTNGKYKSVRHRAILNNTATRMSVVFANGPAPNKVITPAEKLVDSEHPAAFKGMTYVEYLALQGTNRLHGKTGLDRVRI